MLRYLEFKAIDDVYVVDADRQGGLSKASRNQQCRWTVSACVRSVCFTIVSLWGRARWVEMGISEWVGLKKFRLVFALGSIRFLSCSSARLPAPHSFRSPSQTSSRATSSLWVRRKSCLRHSNVFALVNASRGLVDDKRIRVHVGAPMVYLIVCAEMCASPQYRPLLVGVISLRAILGSAC